MNQLRILLLEKSVENFTYARTKCVGGSRLRTSCCLGYLFKNSIVNIALCRNHLNKWLQFSIEDIPFDNERWERIRDSMHNLNKTKETYTDRQSVVAAAE